MLEFIIEMIKDNKGGLLFVLFLVILFFILYAVLNKLSDMFEEKVIRTSKRINALMQLNSSYSFYNIKPIIYYSDRLKNKSQFDRYNFDKHIDDIIEAQIGYYDKMVAKLNENAILHQNYLRDLEKISCPTTIAEAKEYTVFAAKYIELEDEIFFEKIINPVVKVRINFKITYTSPQGRNSYTDSRVYSYTEVLEHMHTVKRKAMLKTTKEYQRKIMTESLRYDILKRDRFKCVLCGCTQEDGIKLEVDHIIPVSKGGKTESTNLRTLCNRCNAGKRDKYDEMDIN